MRLTVFLTDDKADFHVLPLSYDPSYSFGFYVYVRLYVRTPLAMLTNNTDFKYQTPFHVPFEMVHCWNKSMLGIIYVA